jgi:flagellar assembly protein FliH
MSGPGAQRRPFLFGEDLRAPPDREGERRAAERDRREAAERDAFARGLAQGRADAEAEAARRTADALDRIASSAGDVLRTVDGRVEAVESEALLFFRALAERFAGRALAADPLAAVADAAAVAFRQVRDVPHLAIRLAPNLVDGADLLLRGMARERGFEGRIIVIGDDEIEPGDARIEWADGGVVRDRRDLEAAVSAVLSGSEPPRGARRD